MTELKTENNKSVFFVALRIFAGAICMFIGIIGLLLPILPGWAFIFLALLLLFPESGKQIIEKIRVWMKKRARRAETELHESEARGSAAPSTETGGKPQGAASAAQKTNEKN